MDVRKVISKGLCLGCGICMQDPTVAKLKYVERLGLSRPIFADNKYSLANEICPGQGYDIIKISSDLYKDKKYCIELGRYESLYAGHTNDDEVLKNASSGGVMTEILLYLLDAGIVSHVGVTKFTYGRKGVSTKTILTQNRKDILDAQGSKYCPVNVGEFLAAVKRTNVKAAVVGTPCQIAGIRKLQEADSVFKERIVLTIANFCGGFKNYNQIKKISMRHNIASSDITYFRFRGGGQPGSLLIRDSKGQKFEVSYLKYGGYTGYTKLLRCHLCVDATGELADICCGDAWLDKFKGAIHPWSVILTRSSAGDKIVNDMAKLKRLELQQLSRQEVILSQKLNLTSKKIRQESRFKLYKLLGYTIPKFDGGWDRNQNNLKTETIVFLKHRLKEFIEKAGLYGIFRQFIKKEF